MLRNRRRRLQGTRILFANTDFAPFSRLKSVIREQPDMDVLNYGGGANIDLMLAVQELQPNIILIPLLEDDREPGICSHLLEEFDDIVIIAISPTKIRRLSKCLDLPFSERTLLETIRTIQMRA
jgi:hypothetical protein